MDDEGLDEVKSVLEDIKALLLVANQERLEAVKSDLLKQGSIESQVYELCDGENTIQDISTRMQKSTDYVSAVISNLRRKRLVRTQSRGDKKVIVQVF